MNRKTIGLVVACLASLPASSASWAATLYGLTTVNLVRFDSSAPSVVTVVGAHGLPPMGAWGVNYLAYHQGTGKFYGVYVGVPGADGSEMSLFSIDPATGAGAFVAPLGNSGATGNYFEGTEYVDSLRTLVISRGTGSVSSSLMTITPAGMTAGLTNNGRDNDYSVFDHVRGVFYSIDPNGLGQLVRTDLSTGAPQNLGALGVQLADLAYDEGDDALYSYDITVNHLHRITTTNGGAPIARTDLGPIAGDPLRGLAVVRPACAGDTNGDLSVDFVDLNNVLSDFGTSGVGLPGDVDYDGDVDFIDLNIVLSGFGTMC